MVCTPNLKANVLTTAGYKFCSHEEADTRMMVHVADAVEKGHMSVMIRTTDTDVIALAVAAVVSLDLNELWESYETGKNHKILPAHLLVTDSCSV